jgi:hypothetical protein
MNQQDKQFYAQLSQDSTQFAQRLGYDYTKLGAEQKNFYDNLTMQQAQFDSRLRQDASQFATSMGYNYDKMVQENDQFDRQLGFDVEKLKQDNQLESDRLSTQLALGNLDFQASASKLAQEAEQFKQEYGLRADELKRDNRELLLKENDRVDNAIAQLIEEAQNGTIDRTSLAALLPGIVDTSTLDEEAKKAKKKMVNEALGISTSSSVKSLLDNINTNPYYKSSSSSFGTPYKTPSALAQGGTTIRSR